MGYREMIWAGMNAPSEADEKWARENGYRLVWHQEVARILKIRDHKERAAKLRGLADCYDAGIITTSRRIVRDLEKEVEA